MSHSKRSQLGRILSRTHSTLNCASEYISCADCNQTQKATENARCAHRHSQRALWWMCVECDLRPFSSFREQRACAFARVFAIVELHIDVKRYILKRIKVTFRDHSNASLTPTEKYILRIVNFLYFLIVKWKGIRHQSMSRYQPSHSTFTARANCCWFIRFDFETLKIQ